MSSTAPNPYLTALPLLPVRGGVLLPTARPVRLPIGRRRSLALVRTLKPGDTLVMAFQRDAGVRDPAQQDLLPIGLLARVEAIERGPQGARLLTITGLERCEIERLPSVQPYWQAEVARCVPRREDATEARMLADALLDGLTERLGGDLDELHVPERDAEPGAIADGVASLLRLDVEKRAQVLATIDVCDRLRLVARLLGTHLEGSELRARIDAEVRDALGRQQKEALLRQQLRAIQKELGDTEEAADEVEKLRARLDELPLPEEARSVCDRELRRLESLQPNQAEYNVVRNYLDWIASLPWGQSVSTELNIDEVRSQLDADHYGLDEVKTRICEHMAVLKLTGGNTGTILCLSGPPGVGKTSLGQSIARATGRPFVRVALGGVRDEAEIRGHRRTYVGALPGRILGALRKAEADNPVFLLDEIDKLAGGGWAGSPEDALLEVLDPEQNATFTDHYLELPFDLSRVLFICTANDLSRLSPPLRDRLEIVDIAGYSPDEKVRIAQDHLLPEQLTRHGLEPGALAVEDAAVDRMVLDYTREAGVRQLKRELGRLCRRVALDVARSETGATSADTRQVTPETLAEHLGKPKFRAEVAERMKQPGVATGLAWTPVGGDILFIETSRMPGKGELTVTGKLGDVMRESARAALTYVRSHAVELGIAPNFLTSQDVHIHVPAGAVPKDGPSAGVTIFTALTSLLTDRTVRSDTAMTGECTLRGRVLPVGGIKSKVLAAHRAGLTRVILPRACERDLDEIPQAIRDQLEFLLVDDMEEVLAQALMAA